MQPLRMLIVEDSEDDALLIRRAIEGLRYEVSWDRVDSAESMRNQLRTKEWDLIISDYSMPKFSGIDALDLCTEEGVEVPFILVSGTIGEEVAIEAMVHGAHDYVMKDNLGRLVPAIQRELREAKMRKAYKNTQHALAASEALFRSISEQSLVGICVIQNNKVSYANEAMCTITALQHHEILDVETAQLLSRIHKEDADELLAAASQWPQTSKTFSGEYLVRIYAKGGEMKWCSIYTKRIVIVEDDAILCVVADVTQQKQSEEGRKRLEERMQQSKKMESLGIFAGGIAHDFNNVLMPILGYAEVLKNQMPEDSEFWHQLNEILKAATRGQSLIGQIKMFSQEGERHCEPILVAPAVAETVEFLRATMPRTMSLQFDASGSSRPVLADATDIHRIVMNLGTNSVRAMQKNGGTLTIAVDSTCASAVLTSVTPHLEQHQWYSRISVSDTGAGMGAEELSRACDPFFTTKDKGSGSGLGLAIVHSVARNLRGDIVMTSEPGKGTRIEVYIPELAQPT